MKITSTKGAKIFIDKGKVCAIEKDDMVFVDARISDSLLHKIEQKTRCQRQYVKARDLKRILE